MSRGIAHKGARVVPYHSDREAAQETLASQLSSVGGVAIHSQSAVGRLAIPEQVARTVAFVSSEAPDFMTGPIVDVKEPLT